MAGYVNAGIDDAVFYVTSSGQSHAINKPGTYVQTYIGSGTANENYVVSSGVFGWNGGATAFKVVDAAGNLATGTQSINIFAAAGSNLTFNGSTGTTVGSKYGTTTAIIYSGNNFNIQNP